jgi:hypothetical protein
MTWPVRRPADGEGEEVHDGGDVLDGACSPVDGGGHPSSHSLVGQLATEELRAQNQSG